MDNRTLEVIFKDAETREKFRLLCEKLGHQENDLAQRLLTNFITYCEEQKQC